jgi:hypothetical protein
LRDTDLEQVIGLLVLLLVTASITITSVMVVSDAWSPAVRAAWSLGAIIVALLAASTNWTRRSLRGTGVLAVLLVGLMILDIGRDQLARDPAERGVEELEGVATALDALQAPAAALPEKLEAEREAAASGLVAAIIAVQQDNPDLASRAQTIHEDLVAELFKEGHAQATHRWGLAQHHDD